MSRSAASLVYNAAAVRRILGLAEGAVVVVREWFSVVWVWVKGRKPQLWSKARFKRHFADFRRQSAQLLTVMPSVGSEFAVLGAGSEYQVLVLTGEVRCQCRDYTQQRSLGSRRCCKHGYAVLSSLGYNSLSAYLDRF
jgi:hypothetical protein